MGGSTPLAPDRHPRRAPGWWALGLTAVACLAIGRATVPRDEPDPPTLALPARLRDDDDRPETPTPSPVHTPLALATDDNPPSPATPALGPDTKRDAAPQAVRREAVTQDEALQAAQRDAVPSLRTCTGVPRHVTADLDIVRGRGVVTALNLRPVDLDDPKSWHDLTALPMPVNGQDSTEWNRAVSDGPEAIMARLGGHLRYPRARLPVSAHW